VGRVLFFLPWEPSVAPLRQADLLSTQLSGIPAVLHLVLLGTTQSDTVHVQSSPVQSSPVLSLSLSYDLDEGWVQA
jgi:hypothetical protein